MTGPVAGTKPHPRWLRGVLLLGFLVLAWSLATPSGAHAGAQRGAPSADSLAAGFGHSCAIENDGAAACWGWDLDGQSTVPAGLGPVTAIAAGDNHTCAIEPGGTVACWGLDTDVAIGAPGEGALAAAGAVHGLYGAAAGLTGPGSQRWTQDSTGVADVAEAGDGFGGSLGP